MFLNLQKYILQQLDSMSQKKDKFLQAIQIYKSKYLMQVQSILKFIKERIDSPPEVLQRIEEMILSYQSRKDSTSEQQLKNYFHLVAAVQANVDIRDKELNELTHYTKIKFKSKKSKQQEKQHLEQASKHPEKSDKKGNQELEKQEGYKNKQEGNQFNKKQVHTEQVAKPQGSYGSPRKDKLEEKKPLGIIEENVVEEDRTSNVIRAPTKSQEFFVQFPEAQIMQMRKNTIKQVQIRGYDKFGQNFFNPIIKYRVTFKEKSVYRRYTEFQNLMKYLNKRFQGFILPELPPKQGIKSNLSYIWGIDEAFLDDRQNKLEQMLNVLMNSKFVSEDEILLRFLQEQDFQVESSDAEGTLNYLRSLGQIAFNARQLKNYGMAYYNYFKNFKKTDINTKVTDRYKEAQPILSYCLVLEGYRTTIIANFDKRREIFKQLQVDQSDRTLTIPQFDKLCAASAAEVRNLDKEMNKYYQLKSQQSWLGYLKSQKEYQCDSSVEEVKKRHKDILIRIEKMEQNLAVSITNLVQSKSAFLDEVGGLIIEWRKCIHP